MSVYWRATSASTSYLIGTILLNNNTDLSGGLTQTSEYNSADGNVTWLMPAFGGTNPAGTFQSWDGTAWPADSGGNGSQRYAHSSYRSLRAASFIFQERRVLPQQHRRIPIRRSGMDGRPRQLCRRPKRPHRLGGGHRLVCGVRRELPQRGGGPGDMWAHAPNLVLTHPVPEPSTMLLTVVGLIGALACTAEE